MSFDRIISAGPLGIAAGIVILLVIVAYVLLHRAGTRKHRGGSRKHRGSRRHNGAGDAEDFEVLLRL